MSGSTIRGHRRAIATVALSCAAALTLAPAATAAPAEAKGSNGKTATITVMGTSDLHGYIENWDYFTDAEYTDAGSNDIGLAKISSLVKQIRADRGAESTLLIDNGDTIQGSALTDYFANVEPVTESGEIHPMAAAMNAMGYDAGTLGNHEFNYGLDLLNTFEEQADFPLLGANVVDWETGEAAFTPYVLKTVKLSGQKPITVGILGLTTPGSAIWDKNNVEGELRFLSLLEQAEKYVPEMKAEGADVVVVSSHSGPSGTSSYGGDVPLENASTQIAEEVPGIDAILAGHEHREIAEQFITNKETGDQVLLTEPKQWGQRLSVMDFELTKVRGQWDVTAANAELLNANTVPADPEISALVADQHQRTIDYVNTAIGTATATMSAAESRYRDTAVMDFVNKVQADALDRELEGTPNADLPVLSLVAPFNRAAVIPEGPVTIRDMAGLYVFPNTLSGVEMTGAQIKDYLEYSARYFNQIPAGVPVDPATLTNAGGTPDYNYDMLSGVSYDIDISKPVGERIVNLSYDGAAVEAGQRFAVATNNYRQSGGGGFPHIATAPVLANQTIEIRQLLIDYLVAQGSIDPSDFFVKNWQLTRGGEPVFN